MNCLRCRRWASAALDGEATPDEVAEVTAHLAHCAECRAATDRAEEVTRLARAMAVEPAPDLTDAIMALVAPAPGGCGCPPTCQCGCQAGRACQCRPQVA